MKCTATQLRNDIYRILDRILETGEPVEIERGGRKLKIVIETVRKKPPIRWVKRDGVIKGNAEDYTHIDWTETWKPDL